MHRNRSDSALAMARLAAILLPAFLHAQITFQRTYGGPQADRGYSVQQTTDGGYVITGETRSFGAAYYDVYLIRTDAQGDTLWTRAFGGRDWDVGYSAQQTADGGDIIAGKTVPPGTGLWDVYLIKTDAGGDTMWTRVFGGEGDDWGNSVQQTADSGFIIAGVSLSVRPAQVYLIKTDANGDTLWTSTFGGTNGGEGRAVEQTADSGYVIAGSIDASGPGNEDVYLIKTDANGDTLWTRTYGGDSADYALLGPADGGWRLCSRRLDLVVRQR